jgi:hypothetical protein
MPRGKICYTAKVIISVQHVSSSASQQFSQSAKHSVLANVDDGTEANCGAKNKLTS